MVDVEIDVEPCFGGTVHVAMTSRRHACGVDDITVAARTQSEAHELASAEVGMMRALSDPELVRG